MSETRCCRATVDRVFEEMISEKTITDDAERERRTRVQQLTQWDLGVLAKKAEMDRVTVRRALLGLKVRPSSMALISRALAREGRSDLLPAAKAGRKDGVH